MNEKELQDAMNILYVKSLQPENNIKKTIADAVALGMKYREEEIKSAIDIVFKMLHVKKN